MTQASTRRVTWFVVCLMLGLGACAETELIVHAAKEGQRKPKEQTGIYKVGQPYQIAGTWYYPREDYEYVETGIASWYGPGFHGKLTANGEIYDQNALTAAHRTLPMPSIVRVINLENGRSLKVRINDRGPFKKGRIIDLSREGARLLGFEKQGTAKVRVEILASESRRAATAMQQGEAAASAPPAVPLGEVTAVSLSEPGSDGEIQVAQASATTVSDGQSALLVESANANDDGKVDRVAVAPTDIFVQVGAFGQLHNAIRMRARVKSLGPVLVIEEDQGSVKLFRVQLGPIGNVAEADQLVRRLAANGITDVQVVVR